MAEITQTTTNPLSARDRWELTQGFINTLADAYSTIRTTNAPPEALTPSLIGVQRQTPLSDSLSSVLLIGGGLVLAVVAVKALL